MPEIYERYNGTAQADIGASPYRQITVVDSNDLFTPTDNGGNLRQLAGRSTLGLAVSDDVGGATITLQVVLWSNIRGVRRIIGHRDVTVVTSATLKRSSTRFSAPTSYVDLSGASQYEVRCTGLGGSAAVDIDAWAF